MARKEPASPNKLRIPPSLSRTLSQSESSLRRKSAYLQELITRQNHHKGYDREYKDALLNGEVGNGVRTWYSSFTTIDWLHDQCKEDWRISKLRSRRGIRGFLANQWDRLQGWIAVLIIGLATAFMAAGVVGFEMWLFDLKGGYCSTAWYRAKRFCTCPANTPLLNNVQTVTKAKPMARSAISSTAFMNAWARAGDGDPACTAWRPWGEVLGDDQGKAVQWLLEYGVYIALAVSFATFASILTIYLSASTSVVSVKDAKLDSISPDFKAADFPHLQESRAHLKRSASVQSYGSINFSPRQTRYGHSTSNSMDAPLLTQSPIEEEGNKTPTGKHAYRGPTVAPRKVMYFAAGSGIPEIKTLLSGFVIRGYLGAWTLSMLYASPKPNLRAMFSVRFAKAVGLCFAVGSGLSLGKEGPFVHIASCIGNITTRFFPKFEQNEAKRREVLSAACAAGVAVAFGAPVGGVLFSLEEVSYFFPPKVMFRSFVCAMVAAVTLKLLDPFGSGKIVLFEVTYDKDFHWAEMFGFALLGIFGGLFGALFNKANITWTKRVRNGTSLKQHPILECALICLLTAAIAFFNPYMKMGGTELVYEMFSECRDDNYLDGFCPQTPAQVGPLMKTLALALVGKALITVVTFGIKLPAGIFIPTLAAGALFGRILGLAVEVGYASHPEAAIFGFCRASGPLPAPFGQACVLPGVWAMVGAAATLAGVTRTTVSLAVIMFELTGTLTYVVPVMIAVLFAKTVGDAVERRSIYDLVIEMAQLPFLDAKEEHVLHGSVLDVVDIDAPLISLDRENTVDTMELKLSNNEGLVTGFPIIKEDDGPRLQGYIGFDELEEALRRHREMTAEDVPQTPCTFRDTSARVHLRLATEDGEEEEGSSRMVDLGYLTDRAPVTVSARAPLQLVHQLFVKLGVRYLAVQDERGCYVGIIEKNRWLGYLSWVESQH